MIIDVIANAGKYTSIHPLFAKAFEYIQSQNLTTMEVGKYDINNGLKASVSDKNGLTVAESIAKFECHNQNIDIQLCINGKEQIGWKPRSNCIFPKGDYQEEKDVLFYNETPDTYFQLTDGQFAIFFPEDVHAPMISEGRVKKMVIKVKI
jgi:YhcH/YjgK/YiaL family protein